MKYCHDAGVRVYYTANGYYMHENFQSEFKKYLEIGVNAGVDTVKIIGRGSTDPTLHAFIVEKYVKYIDLLNQGYEDKDDIKNEVFGEDEKVRAFWERSFCVRERCKLRPTKITNSYIM